MNPDDQIDFEIDPEKRRIEIYNRRTGESAYVSINGNGLPSASGPGYLLRRLDEYDGILGAAKQLDNICNHLDALRRKGKL